MTTRARPGSSPAFLSGGGEMGARIRAFDWQASPLGDPRQWPEALKTLVDLMLVSRQPMFIAWGPAQTWLYNDAFVPILGSKHPGALGRPAIAEVWHEARAVLGPLFARVFGGEPVHMDDFGLMLDRHGRLEEAHFAFSYTPVHNAAGTVAGLFGVCIETTERFMAAQRELAALQRQRQMFEQAPSFVCMLGGPDHVFEFVNNAHRLLFNSGSWIGKPIREAFSDLAGQGYFERLDEVYSTGKRYVAESAVVRFSRFPGDPAEERVLNFIYEPVRDDLGDVTGIFCEGFDVTEVMRTQQKLRDADRRKDEFLATLAHELRNPLAPMRNALYLARQDQAAAGEAGRITPLLGMMERQTDQMVRLVDDLLDVARISQGKIALRLEAVEVARLMESVVESTASTVKKAGRQIALQLPDVAVFVHGDALRLTQVLSNLIHNAVKFSEPGGTIRLGASGQDGDVVLSVEDRGIGIPADKLEEVFEMFSQLDGTMERTKSGLGLGLALARQIVLMHGGTIVATSGGAGMGSEFTIRLARLATVDRAPQPGRMPSVVAAPRRIVIADDNRDAADSMAMLLRVAGHEVEVAYNGQDALDAAQRLRPDVLLLDIGMPRMNGYDVARAVRREAWAAGTTIVALTGWGQERDKERSRDAGIDHHLVKPVDIEDLNRAVLASQRAATSANE